MPGYSQSGYGLAPGTRRGQEHAGLNAPKVGGSLGYKPIPNQIAGDEDPTTLIAKYDLNDQTGERAVRSALQDLGYDSSANNPAIQNLLGQSSAIRQAYLLHSAGQGDQAEGDPTQQYARFVRDVVSRGSTRSIFSSTLNQMPQVVAGVRDQHQNGGLNPNPALAAVSDLFSSPGGDGYQSMVMNLYRQIFQGDPNQRTLMDRYGRGLDRASDRGFYGSFTRPAGSQDLFDYLMNVNPYRL